MKNVSIWPRLIRKKKVSIWRRLDMSVSSTCLDMRHVMSRHVLIWVFAISRHFLFLWVLTISRHYESSPYRDTYESSPSQDIFYILRTLSSLKCIEKIVTVSVISHPSSLWLQNFLFSIFLSFCMCVDCGCLVGMYRKDSHILCDCTPHILYRVAKTHRIPYLYRSFSAKVTYI